MRLVRVFAVCLFLSALLAGEVQPAEKNDETGYVIQNMTVAEYIKLREGHLQLQDDIKTLIGVDGTHLTPSQRQEADELDKQAADIRDEIRRLSTRPPGEIISVRSRRDADTDSDAEGLLDRVIEKGETEHRIAASSKSLQIGKIGEDVKVLENRSRALLLKVNAQEASARRDGILPTNGQMLAFREEIDAILKGFDTIDAYLDRENIEPRDGWPSRSFELTELGYTVKKYNSLEERLGQGGQAFRESLTALHRTDDAQKASGSVEHRDSSHGGLTNDSDQRTAAHQTSAMPHGIPEKEDKDNGIIIAVYLAAGAVVMYFISRMIVELVGRKSQER